MRNRDKRKARKLKQQMKTLHLSPREAYLGENWQPPAEGHSATIRRQIEQRHGR